MHTYVVALRRCITDNKNTYYGQMFSHAFENVWSKAIVATNRMLHSLFFSLVSTFLPFFFLRDYLTLGSTLVKEPKIFSINKEHRVKCSIFLLLDFDISIIRQLTSYKIHRGSATVIWQGAGWHEQGANFLSIKSCNYANAAGRPRGANSPPFQATVPTFYELLSGSEANETVRSTQLVSPPSSHCRSGSWCHYVVKRPCGSYWATWSTIAWNIYREQGRRVRESTWPPQWPCTVPLSVSLHVNNIPHFEGRALFSVSPAQRELESLRSKWWKILQLSNQADVRQWIDAFNQWWKYLQVILFIPFARYH